MAETVEVLESTVRDIEHMKDFIELPAGTVLKIIKDGVDEVVYTVAAGQKFSGHIQLMGSETDE